MIPEIATTAIIYRLASFSSLILARFVLFVIPFDL